MFAKATSNKLNRANAGVLNVANIVVGSLSYAPVFTNIASAITPPVATKNGATTP